VVEFAGPEVLEVLEAVPIVTTGCEKSETENKMVKRNNSKCPDFIKQSFKNLQLLLSKNRIFQQGYCVAFFLAT
jgi:hypothetical protein